MKVGGQSSKSLEILGSQGVLGQCYDDEVNVEIWLSDQNASVAKKVVKHENSDGSNPNKQSDIWHFGVGAESKLKTIVNTTKKK